MDVMYAKRRQRLLNDLGDGLLLLPTAAHPLRNGDVRHDFRPGSDFHYACGYPEPHAILVAWREGRTAHRSVLFVLSRNKAREIWDGPRHGVTGAVRKFGVDEAYPVGEIWKRLPKLLKGHGKIFHTLGVDEAWDQKLMAVLKARAEDRRRSNPPTHEVIEDPKPFFAKRRLIKSREEIELMAGAAGITAAGHLRAMSMAKAGLWEYEVQAGLEAEFRRQGSRRNGYISIVASGPNACILHYIQNDRRLRKGDLLLVDAGAECGQYTADITRTFPVGGRFSEPQKAIYQAVLRAQKAGIRAVKPGVAWDAAHKTCIRVITRELQKLGLLRGKQENLVKKGACRKWFMHGTSHWLGMDVHDVGAYEDEKGKPVRLRPGMVLTVEPGLYFGQRDKSVPPEYRGIGVRIEDNVLVTRSGNRVLTAAAPKEVSEVEAACQDGLEGLES